MLLGLKRSATARMTTTHGGANRIGREPTIYSTHSTDRRNRPTRAGRSLLLWIPQFVEQRDYGSSWIRLLSTGSSEVATRAGCLRPRSRQLLARCARLAVSCLVHIESLQVSRAVAHWEPRSGMHTPPSNRLAALASIVARPMAVTLALGCESGDLRSTSWRTRRSRGTRSGSHPMTAASGS